ncbi:MAG: hypothetical protein ACK40H_03140 [Sphingomonadaceae bacterium]
MRQLVTATALLFLAAAPAQASLIGTQVTARAYVSFVDIDFFASLPQPATVVDPGVEFALEDVGPRVVTRLELDLAANSLVLRKILVSFTPPVLGFVFFPFEMTVTFLSPGLVTGVSVAPGATIPLFAGPTLTGDVLTFTTQSVFLESPGTLVLPLTLRLRDRDPVPAPGALALFGLSLLGLGAARALRAR